MGADPGKEKIPTIYLLALTRYYAGQAEITADEKKQLQIMVNILLESEMVFPYMKDLGRFVSIPEDIMDKTMIEYRGDKNVQPWIEMRILPRRTILPGKR